MMCKTTPQQIGDFYCQRKPKLVTCSYAGETRWGGQEAREGFFAGG